LFSAHGRPLATRCEVSFLGAEFSGGEIDFGATTFSGSEVDFGGARFSSGLVHFGAADFGEVRLVDVGDWSHPPTFGFNGSPPTGLRLPEADLP
jgi:hypothetical protein